MRYRTILRCEKTGCTHLARKGPRGYCTLKKRNIREFVKCPKGIPPPEAGFIPSYMRCRLKKCEQLQKGICKQSGYYPHMLRKCPKVEEVKDV